MCFSQPSYLLYSSSFFFQVSDFSSSSTVPNTPQLPLSNHLHTRISNSLTCARTLGSFQDHLSHILQGFFICEIIVPGMAFLIKTLLSALCSWFQLPLPQYWVHLSISREFTFENPAYSTVSFPFLQHTSTILLEAKKGKGWRLGFLSGLSIQPTNCVCF